ncbi:MAG: phosphoribosylamine--glycine ligase [Clostridium sp.]|nr:phosphoribosylamine--glycine ligase [Clostridium sp.]
MNILIVGSGAKEYTMAKEFSKYENVDLIFAAPGNFAISDYATCIDIEADDVDSLAEFVKVNNIDLTVASSEKSVECDIAGKFNEEGLMIFSPTAEAARITSSKSIAKKFMYKTKVPTPKFGIFDRENMAVDYARKSKFPLVIKTDSHMHGENVFVCDSFKIAKRIIEDLFDNGNKKIVIEDFIAGQEFSYYVITDGYNAMPVSSVVPYKHVLEGNGGAITSGLGAYAPFYMIDSALEGRIFKEIIYPTLDELGKNGNQYVGILGVDIILDRTGNLNVIEFNPFFKEPDAQCVFNILDINFVDVMKAAIVGSLVDDFYEIKVKPVYSLSVVLNAGGYPQEGKYGSVISGLDEVEEHSEISHFNTRKDLDGNFVTAGGRTLVVTSSASTLEKAVQNTYESIESINFDGKKYRKDIGKTLLIGC